ncbi:hypothetical protein H310_07714 [Aphanomyces invadans]|uniref:Major facilitator superfamily (MFS) profile domain-containing protein n=1 Tax=Aphanomyces invadans TaxID=157072 RepID=A0A024TZP2_9STRA|nr:hypothetical protein H310_07714 [Aphanomyces invadans]ETV99645.1 hypothetical protein H310_07714 [Aphanomyces invadans]|eukprot:XP_008871421.1 hypothetical protein H310_07714 [Aphanomyces invadans]
MAANVQEITRRLDALPTTGCLSITPHYWGLLLKTGVGWAMDSMDTFVFIYLGLVPGGWGTDLGISPTSQEAGLLGSSAFVGSLFGSFLFGQLADLYGRKKMFMITLLVFMVGTLLCGVSNGFGTLLVFRFLAGLGLGGELPVASALVQEMVPTSVRGRIIVILESFWAVGCMLAVLMSYELIKVVSWRVVFYISSVPALYAIFIRFFVSESPKWLASVGRMEEAEAVVAQIESAHGVPTNKGDDKSEVALTVEQSLWLNLTQWDRVCLLFKGELCSRTLVLWTVWTGISFSYFSIFIWLPILRSADYDINANTWEVLFIVFWQLPGYFSAAYVVELLGRKITLFLYLMGSFGAALAFGYVEGNQVNLLITGSLMSWFMLGAWGSLYAYTPENYPTNIRAMGCAYPGGVSRVGAIAGSYIIPIMLGAGWGIKTIMWVAGGVPLIFIALVLLVFGYETRGQDLESVPLVEAHLKEKHAQFAVATPVHE